MISPNGNVVIKFTLKKDEEILKKNLHPWVLMFQGGACVAGGKGLRVDIFPIWEAMSLATGASIEDYESKAPSKLFSSTLYGLL